MKAASVKELRQELNHRSQKELIELCLRLSKFKKENKELLTYLLYDADNEEGYIRDVKAEIDLQFDNINTKSYYFIKKSVRKIQREVKKYIRYSKKKETEVELLVHFCKTFKEMKPSMSRSTVLKNIYDRQIGLIKKNIAALHEDLQYDYTLELESI
ncbi:MAG: hypothetical protein ACI94Y_000772 [Maribacter sp.]|jgi:hypothetical protein